MIVAGIGCRRNSPSEAIVSAIEVALAACGLERSALGAIATAADKAAEPGLLRVAEDWNLPLVVVSEHQMKDVSGAALTKSARVHALKGVPSVAETAALAAVGRTARLMGARVTNAHAACAIAIGDGPGDAS